MQSGPQQLDKRIGKGRGFTMTFTVTDATGAPATPQSASYGASSLPTPISKSSPGNGITIAGNVVTIEVTAADTAALDVGAYSHDAAVILTSGAKRDVMQGLLLVEERAAP